MTDSGMEELFDLVRRIPRGRVASYGDLGRALRHPVSGLIVGRWMARCPEDLPWWRVVARDGSMPVARRDPSLEALQTSHLANEGIRLENERVVASAFWIPYLD